MGAVYRAQDPRLNRVVAIKVSAVQFSERFEREAKAIAVAPYSLAVIDSGLGEKDQAFDWLERASQERSYFMAVYLTTDARLDSLHSDPRFEDLRKRVGLPKLKGLEGSFSLGAPKAFTR